jgi:putative oxidoreductase
VSLTLVIFAEVFCAIAVMLGVLTRVAAIPLIFAMLVAAFIALGGQALAVKELALLYMAFYAAVAITGPGRYSVDNVVFKW